jgi:hypothetical protein
MNWWEWVAEFSRRAAEAEDMDRLRLVFLQDQLYYSRERAPLRSLALCAEGRQLARQLNEPWWDLCFQTNAGHVCVHFLRDFHQALDLTVATVLEARKPIYDGFPLRAQLYQDLLAVHFCTDPEGHAERIEEGFREIEPLLDGADLASRLHFLNMHRWGAEQSRQVEEHHAAAQRVLALIAEHPGHPSSLHYSTFVYNGLCRVHFARKEWQELAQSALLAEQACRKIHNQDSLAEASLWQALCALHDGETARSSRLRQQGTRFMAALGVPPTDGYFEALSLCHELAGLPEIALQVRDRELALVQAQGRTISEVYCHHERCRLLAGPGRLTAADLDSARAAARRLRFPDRHLSALEQFAV